MKEKKLVNLVGSYEFKNFKNFFLQSLKSPYTEYKYTIKTNDSIEKILRNFNVESNEIKQIVNKLKEKKLMNIYAGREVSIIVKKTSEKENSVVSIFYPISNVLKVTVRKDEDAGYIATKNIIRLTKKEVVIKNSIKDNLYSSAIKAGVEPNIIIEFARIYGFEIDFQRDIRKGDWFEIYYERFHDDNNVVKDTGKIIYASMYVNNKEINLYSFKDKNEFGFYDINGKSIVKALMKTPINGARLSSGFGNRKHPILGFTKHHNGTDFAAPTGTPIMASGSGTVITAGWCGNGGNCVRIRHNSSYTTGYGHLSKFATKVGKKVRQGQIIGYVGNTGMSTGPHLHYTVKYNGKFINSQKLKLPSGKILKGDARKNFEIERIKTDVKLSELRSKK
tara:strand:- start:688 stop:1863 length:1176 start_codon:yes stop_codon:yes gene_type:complete